MEEQKSQQRVLQGTVVSDKMAKTIVVRVDRMKMNQKYHKQYRQSSRFKVPTTKKVNSRFGDVVRFTETRPLSKTSAGG